MIKFLGRIIPHGLETLIHGSSLNDNGQVSTRLYRNFQKRNLYTEELLGTASANPELHSEFIASKAPDAMSREEEIAAIGADAVEEKGMTVFPRLDDGITPFTYDYQWKGYFKDACGMLRRATGTRSAKLKAFKKEIDGLIFPGPRMIPLHVPEDMEMGDCQRPLRASTAQGERVALAHSEALPAGTWFDMEVGCLVDSDVDYVLEWLQYGVLRGIGQWRNSGKGRFACRVVDKDSGKVLLDNIKKVGRAVA